MKHTLFNLEDNNSRIVLDIKIAPIAQHFQQSLLQHLLKTVDTSDNPEESINVLNSAVGDKGYIDTIQYQFGSNEPSDQEIKYVEENIEREYLYWSVKMDCYDLTCL